MPAPLNTRAFRRQHPSRDSLLEWFRDRNFEEDVVLSFRPGRDSPVPYFKKIYSAIVEFGRTIRETVPYGAVVAPSLMVPTRQVGWPHAHLALQDPVEHEEEFLEIAARHRLGARFDRGPGLLEEVCDHMDRLEGGHFFPFFEPCAHLRGPMRAKEAPQRPANLGGPTRIRVHAVAAPGASPMGSGDQGGQPAEGPAPTLSASIHRPGGLQDA